MTPWKKLLRAHEERNGDSLTLTYLIGALEMLGVASWGEGAEEKIEGLLTLFRDEAAANDTTYVFRCGKLKQPVAQLGIAGYRMSKVSFDSAILSHTTLYIDETLIGNSHPGCALTMVAGCLAKELSEPIDSKRYSYSYTKGMYVPFDEKDQAWVQLVTEN